MSMCVTGPEVIVCSIQNIKGHSSILSWNVLKQAICNKYHTLHFFMHFFYTNQLFFLKTI
jgi:hypothetical protein